VSCPEPASLLHALARPLLFRLDAERAHGIALDALRIASGMPGILDLVTGGARPPQDERLRVDALGLRFANPLGVAAGLDKDAVAVEALAALSFGHVEIGTVTPRPQEGNVRPRVFRLVEDGAAINRLGFPSEGARCVAARLEALGAARPCVVSANVGKNRDTPNERAADDLVEALAALRPHADLVVVNVSSPNTPGLRALQEGRSLSRLVERVVDAARGLPVLVKLAPDLDERDLDAAIDAALEGGARGLVLGNTTVSRPATLRCRDVALEAGGLSGAPLLPRTVALVGHAYRRTRGNTVIVGVGGISSGEDAWRVMRAGATLVQAYTAFIYAGPAFARRVLSDLLARIDREGARSVQAIVGGDA
jgi:dihydroorotate dehydrogenase